MTEPQYTQRQLETLTPDPGRKQVKVKVVPGLYFQTSNRPVSGQFFWERSKNGSTMRRHIGRMPHMMIDRAITIAKGYDDEFAVGRVPEQKYTKMTVVSAHEELMLRNYRVSDQTKADYREALKRTGLGSRRIDTITREDVEGAIALSQQKGLKTTAYNFARLRALFQAVCSLERLDDPTGFLSSSYLRGVIKRHKPLQRRFESLTDVTRALGLARAYAAVEDSRDSRQVVSDYYQFVGLTGLRAWREAAALQIDEVDLEAGTITIPRERLKRKDREHNLILPITEPVRPILERRIRDAVEYPTHDPRRACVFPARRRSRRTDKAYIQQGGTDVLLRQIEAQLGYRTHMHSLRAAYARAMIAVDAPDRIAYHAQDWSPKTVRDRDYTVPEVYELRPFAEAAAKLLAGEGLAEKI